MVSLIWDKRAIPLYWVFLPKLGVSNLSEQKTALLPVFPLLKGYKTVVLADREFCSVELARLAQGAASILLFAFETKRVCASRRGNLALVGCPRFITWSFPLLSRNKGHKDERN